MQAFDETPPNQTCQKVEEIIQSIRNPSRPEKHPFLSSPNEHFIYTRVLVDYPDELYNLSHEGSIASGWLSEISCFWAANMNTLFFFTWDLTEIKSSPTPSPVVCVGYVDGYIVASYHTGISIYSYPDFQPLRSKYSIKNIFPIPENVNVTMIKYNIAGCNDGSLRKITVNPSKCSVSVSGFATLRDDDPIVQIIRTKNYYAALSLNSNISLFSDTKLTRIALFTDLKNILNIWSPYEDVIIAIDNESIIYTLQYKCFKLSVVARCQLIDRRQFQTAYFEHGFLIAVDSDRSSCDSVLTARFGSFPVYSINRNLGGVHSIGSDISDIKIFTSSGVYTISEKIEHNENEEIWRFCNIINEFWDKPVMSIDDDIRCDLFTDQLNEFFKSDFEFLSTLSNYVLTIIDDIRVLQGSKHEDFFSSVHLSDFFNLDRNERFSLLRCISFEIRNKNQLEFNSPPEDLESLIERSRLGDSEASEAARSIITSYKTLPNCYPTLCKFLQENSYYRDLLDCLIQWANSVLSDETALAFENGNFPWKDQNMIYQYHLRLSIYEQMDPLLAIAIGQEVNPNVVGKENQVEDEKKATEALKYALNLSNIVFQRYVLEYLEKNCPPHKITDFIYYEIIDQMKMIGSQHLATVMTKKGLNKEAFNVYIEKATLDSPPITNDEYKHHSIKKTEIEGEEEEAKTHFSSLSIVYRIEYLKKAIALYPHDEKALKLMKCAKLLQDFLLQNPKEPQNLFALDFIEINDILVNHREYELALEIMNIFNEKRTNVLNYFLREADEEKVENYIKENPVFSQEEIAHEIYNIKQNKEAFNFMFNCKIENLYIFKVLCEVWRSGKYREDVDFIRGVLDRAGPVNREIREELADILCEIILELDSKNKFDSASEIRENLKNCFLEQSFTDINDS